MQNRLIKTVLMAALFCFAFSSNALAFDDLKFSVGVKAWAAQWDTFTSGQNTNHELKNAEEFIYIPSATIKYKDFFVTSSYYTQSGFEFDPAKFFWHSGTLTTEDIYIVEADRSEFDVAIGYKLIPQVGVTLGYKQIVVDGHYNWSWVDVNTSVPGMLQGDYEDTFSGFFVGTNFAAAFNKHFAGYGTFSYGLFDEEYKDQWSDSTTDATYLSTEVGLAYMPVKWANITLAYRFQNIESDGKGVGSTSGNDFMRGFMLGANLTF